MCRQTDQDLYRQRKHRCLAEALNAARERGLHLVSIARQTDIVMSIEDPGS